MVIPSAIDIPFDRSRIEPGFSKDHIALTDEVAQHAFDGGISISIAAGIHPGLCLDDPVVRQGIHLEFRGFSRK